MFEADEASPFVGGPTQPPIIKRSISAPAIADHVSWTTFYLTTWLVDDFQWNTTWLPFVTCAMMASFAIWPNFAYLRWYWTFFKDGSRSWCGVFHWEEKSLFKWPHIFLILAFHLMLMVRFISRISLMSFSFLCRRITVMQMVCSTTQMHHLEWTLVSPKWERISMEMRATKMLILKATTPTNTWRPSQVTTMKELLLRMIIAAFGSTLERHPWTEYRFDRWQHLYLLQLVSLFWQYRTPYFILHHSTNSYWEFIKKAFLLTRLHIIWGDNE